MTDPIDLPPRPRDRLRAVASPWVAVLLLALVALLHAVSLPRPLPGVHTLQRATAHLPLDPQAGTRIVALPHVLDDEGPAWWDRVDYELPWPQALTYERPDDVRLALLLPRVGTRFRVLLNGHEVAQMGWYTPADHTVLAAAQPHLVPLPSALLTARASDNRLRVAVRARVLERSGLSPVQLGDHDVLSRRHRLLTLWQVTAGWVMAATSLFIATLALFLWWPLRERLFVLFALASLAHAVRTVMLVVLEPPLGYELVFFLNRVALGAFVGFFILAVQELLGHRRTWVRRGAWVIIGGTPLWIAWVQWAQDYALVRLWAGGLAGFAAVALAAAAWDLWRRRAWHDEVQLVTIVALFALVTGVRDFLVVQLGWPGDGDMRWMPLGGVALMLTMGWVLVHRATVWARTVHRLNDTLAQTVAQRESELRAAFQRLRAAERQRAIEDERRRLMRDMHDGLGSQLVQTLNLVRSAPEGVDRGSVETMLAHALDELRLALDSLEPMEGDLPAILGTLRRRLGPALESAGIELRWEVQDVPAVEALDARGVMHLFRCLQEIFANVVKHAHAQRITVSTWVRDDHIVLSIEDDGVGLPPPERRPAEGRGLRNVLTRAAKMGASVRFYDAHPGTGIEFAFTTGRQPPESDTDWLRRQL